MSDRDESATKIPLEARLESAAIQIELLLAVLDDEPTSCRCCSAKRYGHFGHHVLMKDLGELPEKLRAAKAKLKRDWKPAAKRAAKGWRK